MIDTLTLYSQGKPGILGSVGERGPHGEAVSILSSGSCINVVGHGLGLQMFQYKEPVRFRIMYYLLLLLWDGQNFCHQLNNVAVNSSFVFVYHTLNIHTFRSLVFIFDYAGNLACRSETSRMSSNQIRIFIRVKRFNSAGGTVTGLVLLVDRLQFSYARNSELSVFFAD